VRAARFHRYGPPDVLTVEDAPAPTLRPNDLLVDVHAASVNPVDCKIRAGGLRGPVRLALPWITGLDVSGTVAAVGPEVTGFAVGDAVYASPGVDRPGTCAEQVALDASQVAHKPESLSHEEAATLPLVGLTAWSCLDGIRPGQRVLVQAGSGGVGTFAIQLAKQRGAHVITTCSPRNHQLVRDLGAHEVIDYRTQRFDDLHDDLDLVLDALGGDERDAAIRACRRGGAVACIVSGLPGFTERYGPHLAVLAVAGSTVRFFVKSLLAGVKPKMVLREANGKQLSAITTLVDAGDVRPVVDQVFALEDIAAAHAHVETGRARGKVAIALR